MFLTLAAATTLSLGSLPSCSWNRPGADPYVGEVPAAVERYRDIPPEVRAALRARMERRAYDDIAVIRRDEIVGQHRYGELRDMHFGKGRLCRSVTRSGWPQQAEERGLVYCEQGHCIIVPTICRNVSRVTRLGPARDDHAQADELQFEPPGAGLPRDASFADDAASDPVREAATARLPGEPGGLTGPLAPSNDPAAGPVDGGTSGDGADAPFMPGSETLLPLPTPWVPESGPGTDPVPGVPPGTDPVPPAGPGSDTPPPVPPGGPPPEPPPVPPAGPPFGLPVVPQPGVPPVTPIPEPGTWALMLAGLGLVGLMARRRRNQRSVGSTG